jgi:hypothetical protein
MSPMNALKPTLVLTLVATAFAAATPSASALSCVSKDRPAGPLFDAVVLPAASQGPSLVSPVRLLVLRYRDGGGPRVVEVTTGVTAEAGGRIGVVPGELDPRPGEVYRVAGRLPGGSTEIGAGDVVRTSTCFGTEEVDADVLRVGDVAWIVGESAALSLR